MDRTIKTVSIKQGNTSADLVQLPEGGYILQSTSPFGNIGDVFAQVVGGGWLNVTDNKMHRDLKTGPVVTRDRTQSTARENPKQSYADYFRDLASQGVIKKEEIPTWVTSTGRRGSAPAAVQPVAKTPTAVAPKPEIVAETPVIKVPVSMPITAVSPPTEVVAPTEKAKSTKVAGGKTVEAPAEVQESGGSGQVYDDPIQHALWTQRTEALNKMYADSGMGRPDYMGQYVNFSVHKDRNGKEWAYDRSTGQWTDVTNSKAGRTSVPSVEEWMRENEGKPVTEYDAYVEGEKRKSALRQQAYNDDLHLYGKGKSFFGTEPDGAIARTIGMLGRPNI